MATIGSGSATHLIGAASAIVATLLYLNSLNGDLVFDDTVAIKTNADLRPSSPWTDILWHDFWGYKITDDTSHKSYRPLCSATFKMNFHLHNLEPMGYHLVNVAINALVCYLFALVSARVFEGRLLPTLLSSLLYTVHPIHTEAVAGVVGRAELMCAAFCLLVLLVHAMMDKKGWKQIIVVAILCLASFLSKEQGIMAASACLAYDVLIIHKLDLKAILGLLKSKPRTQERKLLTRAVILGVFSLCLLLTRVLIVQGSPKFSRSDQPGQKLSTPYRQFYYLYLTLVNAQLLLFPSMLRQDYRFGYIPLIESLSDYRLILTLIFFISLFVFGLIVLTRRRSYLNSACFSLALIILFFLPSSNLFVKVGFVVAERVLYVPSMGACLLVGLGASYLFRSGNRIVRMVSKFGIGLLIISYSAKTFHRSSVWNTGMGLYVEALKQYPNDALMLSNLAYVFTAKNDTAMAERIELYAIKTNPKFVQPYRNYGSLLQGQQRYKEAEQMYRKAIELSGPVIRKYQQTAETYKSLAEVISVDETRYHESLHVIDKLVSIAHNNPLAHFERGRYLLKLNKTEEADRALRRNVQASSDKATALLEIGKLYLSENLVNKAAETFREGVDKYPKYGYLMLELGCLIATNTTVVLEDLKLAIRYLKAIVRADPTYERAHFHLGLIYIKLNKLQQARDFFETTLQLNSTHTDAAILVSYTQYVADNYTGVVNVLSTISLDDMIDSSYFDVISLLGNSYIGLGMYDQAQELYDSVLSRDAENLGALNGLGALRAKQNNINESMDYFKRVLSLDSGNKQALNFLRTLK